jgi:hypothetical protein
MRDGTSVTLTCEWCKKRYTGLDAINHGANCRYTGRIERHDCLKTAVADIMRVCTNVNARISDVHVEPTITLSEENEPPGGNHRRPGQPARERRGDIRATYHLGTKPIPIMIDAGVTSGKVKLMRQIKEEDYAKLVKLAEEFFVFFPVIFSTNLIIDKPAESFLRAVADRANIATLGYRSAADTSRTLARLQAVVAEYNFSMMCKVLGTPTDDPDLTFFSPAGPNARFTNTPRRAAPAQNEASTTKRRRLDASGRVSADDMRGPQLGLDADAATDIDEGSAIDDVSAVPE